MPPKNESKKNVEKKAQKLVEDKTFGMKNKNKSKKVQQYVAQVTQQARAQASGSQARSAEWYAAQEAKKKKDREDKKQLEREMLKMLGDLSADPKAKKAAEQKAEEDRKSAEEAAKKQHERDFGEPITALEQVFRVDSKATVPRVCAEVVWLNNLATRTRDNTKECVTAKLSDGSLRQPFAVTFVGWTPTSIPVRTGDVVDVRNATAMVRGEAVDLEVTLGTSAVDKASNALAEHVRALKAELDEQRARGGVPVEEIIEEQRAKLKASALTPVTEARFLEWKQKKLQAKRAAEEAAEAEAKAKFAKGGNVLSGRQLFSFDPSLFMDDEEAAAEAIVAQEEPPASEDEEGGEEGEEGEEGEGEDERGADEEDGEAGDDAAAAARAAAALVEEEDVDLDELDDE